MQPCILNYNKYYNIIDCKPLWIRIILISIMIFLIITMHNCISRDLSQKIQCTKKENNAASEKSFTSTFKSSHAVQPMDVTRVKKKHI